jgi:putative ABC transport system substrate-binding protein
MIARRDFITLLGGAAVWPVAARAQQRAMPVIGLLSRVAYDFNPLRLDAFRRGLKESGFVEGQNVAFEFRSSDGDDGRLPELARDLARRQVSLITTFALQPTRAAKAATSTIPIVFVYGGDAVEDGFVSTINRPGANVTGASTLNLALEPKRLDLLQKMIPTATAVGFLINPNSASFDRVVRQFTEAAHTLGCEMVVLPARTEEGVASAFTTVAQRRLAALVVQNDAVLTSFRTQIVEAAERSAMPAIYASREYATAGGLMSYGPDTKEADRQAGIYAGRILKGEKPANLPVVLPTRFELVINLKAAKALSLPVPPTLLAVADEVIE